MTELELLAAEVAALSRRVRVLEDAAATGGSLQLEPFPLPPFTVDCGSGGYPSLWQPPVEEAAVVVGG